MRGDGVSRASVMTDIISSPYRVRAPERCDQTSTASRRINSTCSEATQESITWSRWFRKMHAAETAEERRLKHMLS
jgi:hypothetical protein